MLLLILLLLAGYILLNCVISGKFDSIANEKGYSGYFWWCFWLGIIGYLMVVALPNQNSSCETENSNITISASLDKGGFSLHDIAQKREKAQISATSKWMCKNCGTLNDNRKLHCIDCGKYR